MQDKKKGISDWPSKVQLGAETIQTVWGRRQMTSEHGRKPEPSIIVMVARDVHSSSA
ncbi:hypothetical protein BFJ68_g7722 [Fusarium oxysporum]|uniref:Uncharacterized protein n=2 Tax=Fusarium oxysporum TaxID=5507 RepID=A0A420R6I3_FUSOX|nr:hypothetical protein BFJ65_g6241 [Fusarium oxysporum f. sp. cepae]RKK36773.1 hypothetical protein BFJ67_g12670 [Fusarium oxysporum f. sp. cepae]RKK51278.1 hypothetical protein BFJ66_g6188 [Fusarium oxysporum f. sp. cepae]RKL12633.1 hypothetical protein BFJ68_g7722 [Fusarium oxysporum]